MINILVRANNRRNEFKKCIKSIQYQTYKDIYVIVSVHNQPTKDLVFDVMGKSGLKFDIIDVEPPAQPFDWNLYCNDLKEKVTDGWFFYLDDDDWIHRPTALSEITPHLNDPDRGIICQFYRGRKAKPAGLYTEIIRGKIGGSCIFLHHTKKNLGTWPARKAGDYFFISEVATKLPLHFVPIPVVQAGNNGRKGQ